MALSILLNAFLNAVYFFCVLLNADAAQTIKDGYGAMHLAAMYCNLRAARVLLQHVENEAKTSSNPQRALSCVMPLVARQLLMLVAM